MRKKVLLLHGWGGSNFPHWQSWLAGELAKEYGYVNFLQFSNFDTPKLTIWLEELQRALKDFKPDIVVTHSLANTLWFHFCNMHVTDEIEKLYLVAPPSMTCSVTELSEFFPLNAPKNLYAKEKLLIVSDNDPYMSIGEAQQLKKELGIDMKIVKNAGHINSDSGYGEWDWMLKELTKN